MTCECVLTMSESNYQVPPHDGVTVHCSETRRPSTQSESDTEKFMEKRHIFHVILI